MTAATALTERTLHRHARSVAVPRYDRRALVPAVVHLSVGSFHRSHQAVYLDELARRGHTAWGLTGVGMRSRAMADALLPQDGLYTVIERAPLRDVPRIVGVMTRYLYAARDPRPALEALAAPSTRLVTLTVTGPAYHVDPVTGAFDAEAEEVVADLRSAGPPRSALGLLVAALDRRRRLGGRPLTLLSCDNLPENGRQAREAVTGFARMRDPALAAWIEDVVAFPSSMVDRITPETTDEDRRRLAEEFGVLDRWPVVTEPFSDWVVEDAFAGERPPLEEVGVRFVDDVRPSALAKTRLLNAVHVVLGALGRLAGFDTVPGLMRDPVFAEYAERLMAAEIAPGLPPSGIDLDVYRGQLLERLANPRMGDQLTRLCRHAPAKLERHVIPSLVGARADRRTHPLLTVAVAGVCRLVDPGGDVRAHLGPLAFDGEVVDGVERALDAFDRDGVRVAVQDALAPDQPAVA